MRVPYRRHRPEGVISWLFMWFSRSCSSPASSHWSRCAATAWVEAA